MGLEILKGGLQTTVQDEGRTGVYAAGLPPSGAMDKHSYRIGNLLVGNPAGAAGLEMTYLGAELRFTVPTVFAITGAEMAPALDGEPIEAWRSHHAPEGSTLSFGYLTSGARAYLAVAGGIDVPLYEASRSTYTLVGLGGFQGRALAPGDTLAVGDGVDGTPGKVLPDELRPSYTGETELRLVVGLASYRLEPESLASLFETTWTVTPDANRVGYRYRGGQLHFIERTPPVGAGSDPANVVDFGYPVGSMQVPGGIEPICLLNDAVTGGGYATVATVISVDLDLLGQSKSNEPTRFTEVDLDQALQARRDRRTAMAAIDDAIQTQ